MRGDRLFFQPYYDLLARDDRLDDGLPTGDAVDTAATHEHQYGSLEDHYLLIGIEFLQFHFGFLDPRRGGLAWHSRESLPVASDYFVAKDNVVHKRPVRAEISNGPSCRFKLCSGFSNHCTGLRP